MTYKKTLAYVFGGLPPRSPNYSCCLVVGVVTCVAMLLLPAIGTAATIQDETTGPETFSVGSMSNENIGLKTVQAAFTKSGSMDNTLSVSYKKGKVTKVYVREYMDSHIILPEDIEGYSLGDETNFHWIPGGENHEYRGRIFFDHYDADTNLTLFGDSGAIYIFYIRAIKHDSIHLPHLTVFVENSEINPVALTEKVVNKAKSKSFRRKGRKLDQEADGEYLRSLKDVDVTSLNYGYEVVGGNDELAPKTVFDDGTWTYFKFADENFDKVERLPVVYKVVDGYDNPMNTRKFKGTIIAESKAGSWTLRHGASHVCIQKVD